MPINGWVPINAPTRRRTHSAPHGFLLLFGFATEHLLVTARAPVLLRFGVVPRAALLALGRQSSPPAASSSYSAHVLTPHSPRLFYSTLHIPVKSTYTRTHAHTHAPAMESTAPLYEAGPRRRRLNGTVANRFDINPRCASPSLHAYVRGMMRRGIVLRFCFFRVVSLIERVSPMD